MDYIAFSESPHMRFQADHVFFIHGGVRAKGRWVSQGIVGAQTREMFFPHHLIREIEFGVDA